MNLSVAKRGETVVVGVEGQLLAGNSHRLREAVLDELGRGERKFEIDLQRSDYLDSSGLGVLVSLVTRVRERGGEVRLANLNDDLRTLFELTKLDALFQFGDSGQSDTEGLLGRPAPIKPRPPGPLQGAVEAEPPDELTAQ